MKSACTVSMVIALTLIGCGDKKNSAGSAAAPSEVVWTTNSSDVDPKNLPDFPHISAAAGAQSYSATCRNPISTVAGYGETEVFGEFTSQPGVYQLESVRMFFEADDFDGTPGGMTAAFSGGRSQIECHNSVNHVSGHDSEKSSLNGKVTVPFEIDSDNRRILSEATLIGQAREGRVAAQTQLMKVDKPMPSNSVGHIPGVSSVLVRKADGKLALRFIIKMNTGPSVQTWGVDAVYKRTK